MSTDFSFSERSKLLPAIARKAIADVLGLQADADENAPWLSEPGACFVTLTQRGRLRGCIGSLQAQRSLLADVKSNAVAAAFRDPRFTPLTAAEFEITDIEISLLSTPERMIVKDEADALAQFQPNRDGVIFECGHFHSTFLPQVWEQLPQPRQFLAHLKQKAGLSPDFWSDEVRLSRYTVIKFCEPTDKNT